MRSKRRSYSLTKRISLYFDFLHKAKSWQSVHSPYIFKLVQHIKKTPFVWAKYRQIETLRSKLKRDNTLVSFKDFGANGTIRERTISTIARNSAKNRAQCKVLAQIIEYVNPQVSVELGTSLGISYAYMATAAPNATITSIEGAAEIAELASKNMSELGLFANIQVGSFDEKLPHLLNSLQTIDFAYIDGNHQEISTLDYFNQLLASLTPEGCIVFDDIYWSEGMTNAWNKIHSDKRVSLSIDLYHIGVIFIRPGVDKQHFKLRL
ncbi:MAG: putative O-methyltransferase YrrM [bacterium]|jgi:predicted O-methyltransferase YrrM